MSFLNVFFSGKKTVVLDATDAKMISQEIKDLVFDFEKAMGDYNKDDVEVGGTKESTHWETRTFHANVVNTLNQAKSSCREGVNRTAILEPLFRVKIWVKHIEPGFEAVRIELNKIIETLNKLKQTS